MQEQQVEQNFNGVGSDGPRRSQNALLNFYISLGQASEFCCFILYLHEGKVCEWHSGWKDCGGSDVCHRPGCQQAQSNAIAILFSVSQLSRTRMLLVDSFGSSDVLKLTSLVSLGSQHIS